MIELYTWPTPNGRKISIALEEFELEYNSHAINIGKDEQFDPAFLKISPNNKIPAIIDKASGRSMMESGAILLYLADTYDKFWGDDRYETLECLMFQMGGLGPMLGQAHHFLHYNPGKAHMRMRVTELKQGVYTVFSTNVCLIRNTLLAVIQ